MEKNAIIEHIIAEILDSINNIGKDSERTVLPWDIQKVIADNNELSKIFGITPDQKTLPLTITVGSQKFTHMLTMDFTMGLILFSDPLVGNHNFSIIMFNELFTSEYIISSDVVHVSGITIGNHNYKVTVMNRVYICYGRFHARIRYWSNVGKCRPPSLLEGFNPIYK